MSSSKNNPNPQYPLWKYVEKTKQTKDTGGTVTIKCNFCKAEWKGTYTRVKAHFMQIPRMGVELCNGDPEDTSKLLNAQMEQRRAEGRAGKEITRPSHKSRDDVDDDSIEVGDEYPSEDEVQFGDENVPSKASKSTTTQARKKPKLGGLGDMFDVKGREGIDLARARFFSCMWHSFQCSPLTIF